MGYRQRTVRDNISCTGIGLHSGKKVRLTIKPSPPNSGIRFIRKDLPGRKVIKASFENVVDTFPKQAVIYRATRQGKTISAKITLMDKNTCYFEWSASLRESLKYAPVHAMNWAAIEDACAAGCSQIDFGRSTAESSHQNFKKYWGVTSHKMSWAYQFLNCNEIPGLNKENSKFSLAISVWKKLPLSLSRILGPPIARRLP